MNALRPEPVWRAGAECTHTNFGFLHLYVSIFRDNNSRAGLFSGTAFLFDAVHEKRNRDCLFRSDAHCQNRAPDLANAEYRFRYACL